MKRILYLFSFFFIFPCFVAQAEQTIQADLISEKEQISSNEEFFLALRLNLPRKWHVYWKNPGDAGEKIDLMLDLPEGFEEQETFWLAPKKFSMQTLTEYGYQNKAYLLVKVKAPENLKEKEIMPFSGKVSLLACANECLPLAFDVNAFVSVGNSSKRNEEVTAVRRQIPEKKEAVFFETLDSLVLRLEKVPEAKSAYFFVDDNHILSYSAPQKMKIKGEFAYLFLQKMQADSFVLPEQLKGTVVFYNSQGEEIKAFEIQAEKTQESLGVIEEPFILFDFLTALVFAFLGGFLLNFMPCVFPLLSLKAFRLLHVDEKETPQDRRKAGIFYTLGILLCFLLISGVLILLKQAGMEFGWGFQLQYPPFVFVLCALLFFLGLTFSEVVSFGENFSAFGMNIGRNWNDFGTGFLAVLVATPCAAPFMGTALGYGLVSSGMVTLCVFVIMGFGMALPFLILDFYPSLGRFLPKAGAWTALLRQLLAFPLYGASAWLLWVLTAQAGQEALAIALFCLVLLGLTALLWEKAKEMQFLKKISVVFILLTLFALVHATFLLKPTQTQEEQISWKPYALEKIEEYRQAKVPVFIKFSAKWCLTCLVNEKTAFSAQKVVEAFNKNGVAAFLADWTTRDDEITSVLESYGRAGVPLYVYYPVGAKEPMILPQIVTQKMLLELTEELSSI